MQFVTRHSTTLYSGGPDMVASRLDYTTCKTCTHTENIHVKYDGRKTSDRECKAYKCDCTKFVKKE